MKTPRSFPLRTAAGLLALVCLNLLPGCALVEAAGSVATGAGYALSLAAALIPLLLGPALMCGTVNRAHYHFIDEFHGDRAYSTTKASNAGHAYTIADTSAAGTPTYADVDGSEAGEIAVTFDNTNEVQNVCLYQGDQLQFDIDNIVEFYARVKMNAATLDTTTSFAIGLTGDRNDAIDSIAQAAIFRIIGDNNIVVETDDGTVNNDDVATGKTLSNSYVDLLISFAAGKSDVRFFVNGQPVATTTTFDMSNYSGALQLFAQIQKTADTNTDGFVLDRWEVRGRKTLLAA